MQETEALDFYERVTGGTETYKEITLEHDSGAALSGVKLHPVSKKELAGVIERLPESMFEAVEGAEDAEEAEAELEESGGDISAVTEETVEAFEDLINKSLEHDELTSTQVEHMVEELDFEVLFRLGTEIINMSVDDTGSIRDFHEQE